MESNEQIFDKQLREALQLHDSGSTYADLRNHFKNKLDKDTISYIIRLVDEFVIEEGKIQENIKKAQFKMKVGLVLFGMSAFILYLLQSHNVIEKATSQFIYFSLMFAQYFPIIFSVYFLWKSYQEELKYTKMEPEIDDTKFRLKRRKKAVKI